MCLLVGTVCQVSDVTHGLFLVFSYSVMFVNSKRVFFFVVNKKVTIKSLYNAGELQYPPFSFREVWHFIHWGVKTTRTDICELSDNERMVYLFAYRRCNDGFEGATTRIVFENTERTRGKTHKRQKSRLNFIIISIIFVKHIHAVKIVISLNFNSLTPKWTFDI